MKKQHRHQPGHVPTVSSITHDGRIVELVHEPRERRTSLAVWDGQGVAYVPSLPLASGETLVPVRPENNLLRHRAVLLPERADEYGSVPELIQEIGEYIDRYVDLSPAFREIAVLYVLLSWVYDTFNELPYLRFRGDFGSGKTRALQVIGSIMYKPFFASGASTVSPIFHTLDLFQGTLIFDETDFRYSDERSEIVKIFNNGNARGLPVLRTIVSPQNEFDPRAFSVFGPKLVSMRHRFQDDALESRFLTEEMGARKLRTDIPINLPVTQGEEAATLRNRLLMYRFRHFHRITIDHMPADPTLSHRANQILSPLLALVDDEALRARIRDAGKRLDELVQTGRSGAPEALVLELMRELLGKPGTIDAIAIQTITELMRERYAAEFDRPITYRYVGSLVRSRLRLPTYKRHGAYVVSVTASTREQLDVLYQRFGVHGVQR